MLHPNRYIGKVSYSQINNLGSNLTYIKLISILV